MDLHVCHPDKLSLALNFSVFNYEILKNQAKASEIASNALEQALDKIDEIEEDNFREINSTIYVLRENLSLWKEGDH